MRVAARVFLAFLAGLPTLVFAQNEFPTRFEASDGTETATYQEAIAFYQSLSKTFDQLSIMEMGLTDSGYPLHVVLYSRDGNFDLKKVREANRRIVFINNGIHPGEPCGVDASMLFFRDLLQDKANQEQYGDVVIASIPLYNIGGALNRTPYSRVNQDGPKAYGFRGNARNFDLNRDFVKQDTRNAKSYATIYQMLDPDVFLDTHTSDGADYQHIMTLVEGQADKLGGSLGLYYRNEFLPALYNGMKSKEFPMVPYVQTVKRTPDDGISGFYDSPRYSSGYAALFQTMAMISEAHMLKTYKERVEATYALIETLIATVHDRSDEIGQVRKEAKEWVVNKKEFPLQWKLDREKFDEITFMGYEAGSKPSEVTGQMRLFYDRDRPWTKQIKNYSYYTPTLSVNKPSAYVIPQSQYLVIENLKRNGVLLTRIEKDTSVAAGIYYFQDYETRQQPYEGHFLHHSLTLKTVPGEVHLVPGDYIAYTNQVANRYLIETLEPQAYDSFFTWNFFDTYIQMKEYFSPYVFDDIAAEYLKEHPEVQDALLKRSIEDEEFKNSSWQQLLFIYQQTPYFEPVFNRYPIFRLE